MTDRKDTDTMTTTTDLDASVFGYAWGWFTHHSHQRLAVINYWLLAVAALTTGLVTALTDGRHGLAAVVAAVGAGTTLAFGVLDRRTRCLVQVAERALRDYETQLAEAAGTPSIRLVAAAHRHRPRHSSYRVVLGALQGTAAAAYATAFVVCLIWEVTR
jgi:hypothetical protein